MPKTHVQAVDHAIKLIPPHAKSHVCIQREASHLIEEFCSTSLHQATALMHGIMHRDFVSACNPFQNVSGITDPPSGPHRWHNIPVGLFTSTLVTTSQLNPDGDTGLRTHSNVPTSRVSPVHNTTVQSFQTSSRCSTLHFQILCTKHQAVKHEQRLHLFQHPRASLTLPNLNNCAKNINVQFISGGLLVENCHFQFVDW